MNHSLTIFIKDLIVTGRHGVLPGEKDQPQRFSITVELSLVSSEAATSDKLADTPDWSEFRKTVVDVVQNTSFNLVERLAQEVANTVLTDKRISKVVVTIEKLDAFESGIPGVTLEVDATS